MLSGDAAAVRAYHEATSHSLERLQRDQHTLDWDNLPRPFKVYPTLDPVPLPRDLVSSERPALAAIADPGTAAGDGPPVDRTLLAHLLYFTAGVLRRVAHPGGAQLYRAAATTGALYHIDLYLVCAPLPDLEAGVWHFGPHDFALRRLRGGDHRGTLAAAGAGLPALREAPVVLVYTSTFWRNAWKYRARTWRHAFWDAGTMLANLLALAAARALPARVVQAFVDAEVNGLLDVDGEHEAALGMVALGGGRPAPPPRPIAPLGLETLPLSPHEIVYPEIVRAHAASSLRDAAAVAASRAPAPPPRPVVASGPRTPLAPVRPTAVAEPVEAVILRRGSARRFPRAPITLAQLATVVGCATRDVPTDCAAHPDLYLVVHAVEGLASGAYVVDRADGSLVALRHGDFRRDAGLLALGQGLAADAAAVCFWLVDLDAALERLGARGYRAAQLAGAIGGGRAYLAAYALGLGATGLTFFDDDVTAFFSPHAAGKRVMFLVALGRRGTRRRAT